MYKDQNVCNNLDLMCLVATDEKLRVKYTWDLMKWRERLDDRLRVQYDEEMDYLVRSLNQSIVNRNTFIKCEMMEYKYKSESALIKLERTVLSFVNSKAGSVRCE